MSDNESRLPGKPLIGLKSIASYLGVSVPTVAELIQQGMPAKKMGNKIIASPANIDGWFAEITRTTLKGQEIPLNDDN
ncbi:MAG: hypothetical protein A4E64_02152 [Syntrophorhabdus sp. PtaU1.Bin058]|nr:MAG: hypothetical protein A4E64_02152 [Syntrophorhabdus sp. PtaU1.Bin058]